MVNLSDLAGSLLSPNQGAVFKALGELRERIEIVHTPDFGVFLQKIFPALRDLLLTRLNPQFTDNTENKCRQIILEVFNRFPTSDTLKPYVLEILKISLKVLVVDNEENSLTALRIIFDLHKSYRPSLESQVQPFLEVVHKILKNIPVSARNMFSPTKISSQALSTVKSPAAGNSISSSQSAPSLTSLNGESMDSKQPSKPGPAIPFLKSMDSFRVLTECPLIIMLLFQVYPKFIQKNIPLMLPLMMNILSLQFSPTSYPPQLRSRFREFVAAQVKTLSLITYFLRGFTDLMKPYEESIANNVLSLVRFCPQESVSTRKELLVDFRHILATDFRKGFYKHLDYFIDERFLMGPGQQAYDTLRPLAFSTIADLVHHAREFLSFAQLSKVVLLFAKSIHDVHLPVIIQTTSVRILMNISEKFASVTHQDSNSFQRDRRLLNRILRTLILKFEMINRQMSINSFSPSHCSVGGADYGLSNAIFNNLKSHLLPSPQSNCDRDEANSESQCGSVVNQNVFSSSISISKDSTKDVKLLIKSLLMALSAVLASISSIQKALSSNNQISNSSSASNGNSAMSMYALADDEVDLLKTFLKWALQSIDQACKSSSHSNVSLDAERKDTSNQDGSAKGQENEVSTTIENDQEVKELLEPLVSVLTSLQPLSLIRSVLGDNLDFIVELSHSRPIFISLLHQLLMSTSTACSQLTMDTLLTYFVSKLPSLNNKARVQTELSGDVNHSATLLKMFKVSLGIISVHPENEKVLRPRLCFLIHMCLRLATEAKYSLNYLLVIRTLFRSISGGKFEHAYKEMNIVLPVLLKGFTFLLNRSQHVETQNAVLELSLTIPCRLDTMLLHFPFLLEMFCRAVIAKKSDSLPNLALRTLEFWTDNLKPDYLFSLMSSTPGLLHRIFNGICSHLKPPPYPYGALAARVLGKFGGKNTRFVREFFSPEKIEQSNCHLITNKEIPNGRSRVYAARLGSSPDNSFLDVSMDETVLSACTIIDNLVPTYATMELEMLSASTSLKENLENCHGRDSGDLSPSKASASSTAKWLEREKERLHQDMEDILQSRRNDMQSAFSSKYSTFSTDLYNQVSAETAVVVKSVIDSQVISSFQVLKSALLQILPSVELSANEGCSGSLRAHVELRLKEGTARGRRNENRSYLDLGYLNASSGDGLHHVLKKLFFSTICSCIFPQLLSYDVSSLLDGVCFHMAMNDALANEATVYSCSFNDAIVLCLSDTRVGISEIGAQALRQWIKAIMACRGVFSYAKSMSGQTKELPLSKCSVPNSDEEFNISSTPLEYILLQAVDLSCGSSLWEERMCGVRIMNELCTHLPPFSLRCYDGVVVEAFLSMVHFSDFGKYASVIEDVICSMNNFLHACCCAQEVKAEGKGNGSKKWLGAPSTECIEKLWGALESSKILVRIAARSGLLQIIQTASEFSEESPLRSLERKILHFLTSIPPVSSSIPHPIVGHMSKMAFLLANFPSDWNLDHDALLQVIYSIIDATKQYDEALLKSNPPLQSSLTALDVDVNDECVLASCYEENIDVVIASYPLSSSTVVEIRSHLIHLFGAYYSSPGVTKEELADAKHSLFRDKCISILHQSLSLKWTQLIERAYINLTTISDCCTISFKDVYDSMKPMLPLFEDIRNLSLSKLKTLEGMIRVVRNKSYLQISWKLLEQLKHWTNPSRIMQLNFWPAGEEVLVAAAIIRVFSVLPWDDDSTSSRHIIKTTADVQSEALHPPPVLEHPTVEPSISPLLLQSVNLDQLSGAASSTSASSPATKTTGVGAPSTSTPSSTAITSSAPKINTDVPGGSSASKVGYLNQGLTAQGDSGSPPIRRVPSGSSSGSSQSQFPIFFSRLIDIVMRIERVRCQYQSAQSIESPILMSLARILNEYPEKCFDYFLESVNLSRSDVIHLLMDLIPLSSHCPKFFNLISSEKGALTLKTCIDVYCNNIMEKNNEIKSGHLSKKICDGVLFSDVVSSRLAELKNSRSRSNSLDGSATKDKNSEGGERSGDVSLPAPSSITLSADHKTSSSPHQPEPQDSYQSMSSQQPQKPLGMGMSHSSNLGNDVLSSPLLLSSYPMQPSRVAVGSDKNPQTTPATSAGGGGSSSSNKLLRSGSNESTSSETHCSVLSADTLRRAAANAVRVIWKLCALIPDTLDQHPPLLKAIRTMLVLLVNKNNFSVQQGSFDAGPLKSSSKTGSEEELKATADKIDAKFQDHNELKMLCECMLHYYRRHKSDILVLFDVVPVMCTPSTLDFSFLQQFFKIELLSVLTYASKKDILRAFLSICDVKSICGELKVKTLQMLVLPLLLHMFEKDNHDDVKKQVLDVKTIKMVMKHAFFAMDVSSQPSSSNGNQSEQRSNPPAKTEKKSDAVGEAMKIELLKVATILIEHCSKELVDNRKDLIKFAWNHLKTDDVTTKHWAYVNVSRFISAYDTPPKIILQVYVALLRTYQVEHRELITMALDTLVPALPRRLKYEDFVKAMKWTKKIIFEEGHSLPQLIHVWHLIIRHASLFYPFRSHFVPQMVSSISRLGLPPNCPVEHRHIALGCAEVLVGWEHFRLQRIDQRLSDSFQPSEESCNRPPFEDESVDDMEVVVKEEDTVMDISVDDDMKEKNDSKSDRMAAPTASSSDSFSLDSKKDKNLPNASKTSESSSLSKIGVVKINEKDDEFALHSSMIQMLVNFLVRLGLFAADNRDRAISKLADKCISLYNTLVSIVPTRGTRVVYFERLFQSFIETYAGRSSSPGSAAGSDKPPVPVANSKANSKATAATAISVLKNKKGEKPTSAKSSSSSSGSSSDPRNPSTTTTASNISEKAFCVFLQFLTASLDSQNPKESIFFENMKHVKRMIAPFFQQEHMIKSALGDWFQRLFLKIFETFSARKTPDELKAIRFFHELSINLDQIFSRDYNEVESDAAAAALAAASAGRKKLDPKGMNSTIGKDNYAVCHWSLQFLYNLCTISPSWVENHGTSLAAMCSSFMTLHLNKVAKNCGKLDSASNSRSSLSSKASLHVNACISYPTTQIAITSEVQKNPGYLDFSGKKINSNISTHLNTLTSSLILLVKILCSALEENYLRSHRDFTLSILHSILEYSDDYTLWGLAVSFSCKWIVRGGSPLSPFEQGNLFNKITNVERWAMDVHAQSAMLRVASLVEVVATRSDNGSLVGLRKLFGSKYSPPVAFDTTLSNTTDSLALRTLGILSPDAKLRDMCADRLLKSSLGEGNSLFQKFVSIFDLNYKCFEKLYWPAALPNLLLVSVDCMTTRVEDKPSSSFEMHQNSGNHDETILITIDNEHPFYAFYHTYCHSQLNSFRDENMNMLHGLKVLPLVNPCIGDTFWKQCLQSVWHDTGFFEKKALTNMITRNVSCHNYARNLVWPEKLLSPISRLPLNVPQALVMFMTSFVDRPTFPIAFLGAVGCGYRLWHGVSDTIQSTITSPNLSNDEVEHAVRVLVALYLDVGDDDSVIDTYRRFSKCPCTALVLDLEMFGFYSEAQSKLFYNMKECLGTANEVNANCMDVAPSDAPTPTSVTEVELEIWEERWMQNARKLSQWDALFDYAVKMNVEDIGLEACSMLSNWPRMGKMLLSMPSSSASISIQIDRGGVIPNPEVKIYEAMLNIVEGKPHRSEKVVLAAVESALHKWHSLPPLVGGSSLSKLHKWLLHNFHRIVELRESMTLIAEAMKSTLVGKGSFPDLKGNLLTWRERLPEMRDDMLQWDTLLHWRAETFSLIKKSFQSRNVEESQMACAHDLPWTVLCHARAARKHNLVDLSSRLLKKLDDAAPLDTYDQYARLREQVLLLRQGRSHPNSQDSLAEVEKGLSLLNKTNFDHFEPQQKAELFRLKAFIQLEIEKATSTSHSASQQSFSSCVQLCPTSAKGWLDWGDLCYDIYKDHLKSKSATDHCDIEYALSSVICILKAVDNNSETGRILLSRVLQLVVAADDQVGTIASALLIHGASLPSWVWLPHVPAMLDAVSVRASCQEPMESLLCTVAKAYPEAMLHCLMTVGDESCSKSQKSTMMKILCEIQSNDRDVILSANWFTSHMEKKFSLHRFSWASLVFLDEYLRDILDDCSARLEDPIPSKFAATFQQFVREVVSCSPRGLHSSDSSAQQGVASRIDDERRRLFLEEFNAVTNTSAAGNGQELTLRELIMKVRRWISIFSKGCMMSTGSDSRLVQYRNSFTKRYTDIFMCDFSLYSLESPASDASPFEIPGQFVTACSSYREPRQDLHRKVVHVLPRVRPKMLVGEVLQYEVSFLCTDGLCATYNLSLPARNSTRQFRDEWLHAPVVGLMDWSLKQNCKTRAADASFSCPVMVGLRSVLVPSSRVLGGDSPPSDRVFTMRAVPSPPVQQQDAGAGEGNGMFGAFAFGLTQACRKEASLASLCYLHSASGALDGLLESCDDAIEVRQGLEGLQGGQDRSAAKEAVYQGAGERNGCSKVLRDALLRHCNQLLRNDSGELFYSMRKTIAVQLGVLGALHCLLDTTAPGARDIILSLEDGRVLGRGARPGLSKLQGMLDCPAEGVEHVEELVGDVYVRLTPVILEALSTRVVESTLRSALGNTAIALNDSSNLLQAALESYCTGIMSCPESAELGSRLEAAEKFVKRFTLRSSRLAPRSRAKGKDLSIGEVSCDSEVKLCISKSLTPSEESEVISSRGISWSPWI